VEKIDHIVVLMLENRSFDHIFGFRNGINGLTGNESNLLDPSQPGSDSNPAFVVNTGAPYTVLAGKGPGHSIHATNYQLCNDKAGPGPGLAATNNGFVRNYKDELRTYFVPIISRIRAPT
jgi:phospholipase C